MLGFSRIYGKRDPRRCSRGLQRWRGGRLRGRRRRRVRPGRVPFRRIRGWRGRRWWRDKGIMLLGGDAGHGVEEVAVVGGTLLDGPILHRDCDGICDGGIKLSAFLDRLLKLFEYGFGSISSRMTSSLKTLDANKSFTGVSLKLTRWVRPI